MEKTFTISVLSENKIAILNRITLIFIRRHLNIDSITAGKSEVKGVYRYTIVLKATYSLVKKVVSQIEKLVDVLKVFLHEEHEEHEVIHREIALKELRAYLEELEIVNYVHNKYEKPNQQLWQQ